jgi:hypothetical protein
MIDYKKIFEPQNRGILLDVIVFVVNTLLMIILARLFISMVREVNNNVTTKTIVALFCLGLSVLSPVGAILKRRGAHQRNPELSTDAVGCFWLPYLLSQVMFLIFAGMMFAELTEQVSGDERSARGLFAPLFLGIPLVAIVNTLIFFFYFMKPRHEPVFKFLQSPRAELLGDICLFLNLIGYQVLWLYLMTELPKDYSGIFDRLFTFAFTAALIYLPPRLYYLIENNRPHVWLMMLLANSPIILRLLLA